jgi:enamine deaminase RidA (YjgF/YER057c/UK114 family)
MIIYTGCLGPNDPGRSPSLVPVSQADPLAGPKTHQAGTGAGRDHATGSLLSGDSANVEPMEIARLQPDGLVVSPAFSHVAVVPAGAATIYVGGQNGVDVDGKIVSDDIAEQSARAIDNASTALAAAGASLADVVQWTVFMAEDADLNAAYAAIGPRLAGPGAPPLVTMARVAALGVPGALVEVSAIAAVVPG